MRAVDTNVLVRIFARDDERQVGIAEAFIESGAWISQVVLMETVWVLRRSYGFDHAEIVTVIETLLSHKTLTLQDPDVVAAALDQYRRQPSLRFTDCLVQEIAHKAGHLPPNTSTEL